MSGNDINTSKYTELSEIDKVNIFQSLCRNLDIIRNLYLRITERAINTLFLLNTGGTVTLLTYLHQSKLAVINCCLKYSLSAFIIGTVFALILVTLDFQYSKKTLCDFSNDMCKYLKGDISYSQIRLFQQNQDKFPADLSIPAGYISLLCIFIGIAFGLIGFFKI